MKNKPTMASLAVLALFAGGCTMPFGESDSDGAVHYADGDPAKAALTATWCDPAQIDTGKYYYINHPTRDRRLSMGADGVVASSSSTATDDSVQWKFTRASGNQFYIDRKGSISDNLRRLSCDWLDPEDPASVGYNAYAVGFKTSKTNKRVTWQLDSAGNGTCWLHCQSSAHPVTGTEPSPPVYGEDYGTVGTLFMKKSPYDVFVADSTDGNEGWNSRKWALEVATPPQPQSSPNLIVVLADDLGYADVGFNGGEEIPTPHIDRIAQGGVRFTSGYVSSPICGPSRAGLLTGRYQNRFGFTYNPSINPANRDIGIPYDEENIAEVLNKASYESMIIGKWHMGAHPDQHPLNRGFDQFYGFLSGGHRYFHEELTLNDLSEVQQAYDWYRTKLMRNFDRVEISQYLTDELSDKAVDFVNSQAGSPTPFFLYLAYNAPHGPLQATPEYLARFSHIADENRRTYAAMVSALDDGVGRVLDALEQQQLADNTIVIFLSDNGGSERNASSNLPLRGWKGNLWEGGVRVPFAMRWPGQIPSGVDYDHPVSSIDILSTISALAGVTSAQPLDGVNLVPYLKGEVLGVPHDTLLWYRDNIDMYASRSGSTKAQWTGTALDTVYNVVTDISETQDILSTMTSSEIDAIVDPIRAWSTELEGPAFPHASEVWW